MKIREFIDEIQVLEEKAEFAYKFSYLLSKIAKIEKETNRTEWNKVYHEIINVEAEFRELVNDNSDD